MVSDNSDGISGVLVIVVLSSKIATFRGNCKMVHLTLSNLVWMAFAISIVSLHPSRFEI